MDLDFLLNFDKVLLNNNFSKFENNIYNIDIYGKIEGSNGYLVIPILKEDTHYKSYFNILEKNSKLLLNNYNLTKIFIFKILISKNFNTDDIDFLNTSLDLDNKIVNIVWGINLKDKSLIAKANQPTKFFNIEKYIYQSLNTKIEKIDNKKISYIVSKNTYLTYSLIAILFLIHILINVSYDLQMAIYNYGISPNLFKNKEFYRLFTFLFLHSGFVHLFSNTLSLYIFGTRIEKYLGKIAFLLIFLIGGLFSGIFSVIFTRAYSIGASGALFALESATLYFSIKEKIRLDGLDYYSIAIFSIIGIFGSFLDARVDNAGHIGGFIVGFIVCSLYYNFVYKTILKKSINK